MPRPIIALNAFLTEQASEFFSSNKQIDAQEQIQSKASGEYYEDWSLLSFVAHASREDEPDGYILRYKKGSCDVSLPAGRAVVMQHQAGFFYLLSSTLPLDPLPFKEIMVTARQVADSFDKAGWKRTVDTPVIKQETFGDLSLGGKFEYFGEWLPCNDEALRVSILLKSYNTLPPGPSIPPVPGRSLPADYPDRYIIEVVFDSLNSEVDNEATKLRDARRLAVNGDKNKPLTLKLWTDEPAWRPEGWQGKFIK